jgi:LuxR family maltose regulon positive regulatory protein
MPVSLLPTKLYIPPARENAVARPHLIEKLLSGATQPGSFTLLSGPAGFGKTTLLSEFVARLQEPVAWVSLDEEDNDPIRFWTYLITACRSILGDVGAAALELFSAPQPLSDDAVPTILINDFTAQDRTIVLVLDDYHEIRTSSIHAGLLFLIDHLPRNLHIVISTRNDPPWPLARYRARNQMVEIRAHDLRFSDEEALEFLNRTMGLELSFEDVAALEARTEGWAAGLQLAALSMQGRGDIPAFIREFTGSHVYIAEYLVEEVLQSQPDAVRRFLLQTSILKQMNAGLCEAVTDCQDGQAMLAALRRANIFVIPLDNNSQWFRYHHLFADLLLARLRQSLTVEAIAQLHMRASHWYGRAGMANEAIQHALAGGDYETAVRLIEDHTVETLVRGYSITVEGWLNSIPSGLHFQSPKIYMAFIWMYLLHGDYERIFLYVERLQRMFSDLQAGEVGPSARAEWLTLQSFLAGAQGKAAESLALAQEALEIGPTEDNYVQSMAYNALASAYQLAEDYENTIEACRKAILHGQATGNYFSEMMGFVLLVQIALQHGQFHTVFEAAREGIDRVESAGLQSPISAVVYGALGQVYYQRHQIEQARGYFLRAVHLSALGGQRDIEIYLRVVFARLLQMEGDLDAAGLEIQKALALTQASATAWARDEAVSQQVRLYLAQNRGLAAEAALKARGVGFPLQTPAFALGPGQTTAYSVGLLYNSALRILLHQVRDRRDFTSLRQGIDLAENLISRALQGNYLVTAIESLLLKAQLHARLGEEQAFLNDVIRALELAEPEGIISIFIEESPLIAETLAMLLRRDRSGEVPRGYIKDILAAFAESTASSETSSAWPQARGYTGQPQATACMAEPLTPREMEVLALIAAGDSNQAIADKLVITVRTVKKHTSNIYGKLGASSRIQAVALARELGLLPAD